MGDVVVEDVVSAGAIRVDTVTRQRQVAIRGRR